MDGGGSREKEGRLEEGEESRTEEEGGARRGRPAESGGRTEEEGGARRGRPAASGGRTKEEAGTESSKEEEVTEAQREEGRCGRPARGVERGSSECVTVSGSDRGDGGWEMEWLRSSAL